MVKGKYIDGFVLVVPKSKAEAYKKISRMMGKVCKKHGALAYKECVGEDMRPNNHGMKILTFPQLAGAKKGEEVWFSFIEYKSRKHRDQVNAKVMKDPIMNDPKMQTVPFDMERMAIGGFTIAVDV